MSSLYLLYSNNNFDPSVGVISLITTYNSSFSLGRPSNVKSKVPVVFWDISAYDHITTLLNRNLHVAVFLLKSYLRKIMLHFRCGSGRCSHSVFSLLQRTITIQMQCRHNEFSTNNVSVFNFYTFQYIMSASIKYSVSSVGTARFYF